MFKDYQTIGLQDLKLYIHKEPDGGGDTFYRKLTHALADTGFTGEVYVWSCQSLGKKTRPTFTWPTAKRKQPS